MRGIVNAPCVACYSDTARHNDSAVRPIYERNLTIFFTGGNQLSFKLPIQATETHSIAKKLDDYLNRRYLMIEAEESVMVFPLENVKYFQFWPAPETLPPSVIRSAAVVG